MSLVHTIDGTDVSSRVEFGTITDLTIAARGGEQGGGKITVTDPSGTLNLRGWHSYTVDETDELTRPRLFTGRLAGKEIKRGPEGPIGAGRVWECDLQDLNTLAHMQIFRVASAKRPPETNLARIAWALSTSVGSWIADTGYVNDAHPRPFEAADYRKNYLDDVLDDVSGVIGRDWFPFWDYDALQIALFYNVRDAAILTSPIYISNVAGDADTVITNATTVFAPGHSTDAEDVVITRMPDEVYDGCLMVYAHGQEYVTRSATTATFFHDAPEGRDIVIENSRIGLATTARLMGESYLEAHSTEKDTIRIPWHVPATHVNHIAAGERIHVRLEHEPGYEAAYVTIRVARKTISEAGLGAGQMRWYDVMLECTDAAPANASGSGAPPPDVFPHPPPPATSYVQEKGIENGTLVLDNDPTDGHLLTMYATARSTDITALTPTGWTMLTHCTNDTDPFVRRYGAVYYKIAAGDDKTFTEWSGYTGIGQHIFEWDDGVTIDTAVGTFGSINNMVGSGTLAVAVTPSATSTVVGNALLGSNDSAAWTFAPDAGITVLYDQHLPPSFPPQTWVGIRTGQTGSTTVGGAFSGSSGWGEIVYAVHSDASSDPPMPGQWVGISPPEIVTMTGASGTTAFPFADGSLSVFVDNLDQTPSITSQNGATGAFTLGFTPKAGEVVTVRYQGR